MGAKTELLSTARDSESLLQYLKWSLLPEHLGGKSLLSGDGLRWWASWKRPLPAHGSPREAQWRAGLLLL
jgi:hypothetical protein